MRGTGWRAALVGVLAGVLTGVLTGCVSSGTTPVQPSPSSGSANGAGVRLTVTPNTALYDTPFVSTVSGLQPGELATLRLSTTDEHGQVWSSQAQFRAATDGSFDTRQAPVSGSYQTADPMGLMQTLTSGPPADFLPLATWTMSETVVSGETTLASATFTRLRPTQTGVTSQDLRPSAGGLYGQMFEPATIPTSAPGVVVIGGSGGGLETGVEAALLAARGYPALALAYFGDPGLPATLQGIPWSISTGRRSGWPAGPGSTGAASCSGECPGGVRRPC